MPASSASRAIRAGTIGFRIVRLDADYVDPEMWYAKTKVKEGSWWPAWLSWLDHHSHERVSAAPASARSPRQDIATTLIKRPGATFGATTIATVCAREGPESSDTSKQAEKRQGTDVAAAEVVTAPATARIEPAPETPRACLAAEEVERRRHS